MNILCGTAGWADKSLIASRRFYPPGCSSAEARLRYYASQYPVVEVDSSYYAMPSASNSALWMARTPESFTFNFKAFRLFSGHQTERRSLPPDISAAIPETGSPRLYYRDVPPEVLDEMWRRYRDALEPLRQGGKLGFVLLQLAPWITSSSEGKRHVEECAARLEGFTVAVEFRNSSWLGERQADTTLGWLEQHRLVHVILDAPEGVKGRAHTVWAVTNPEFALVRLHGRNAATWRPTGATQASARFDYDYSEEELSGLAVPIRAIAGRAAKTHVIFNNCFEDQGQRNARTLMSLFGKGVSAPM